MKLKISELERTVRFLTDQKKALVLQFKQEIKCIMDQHEDKYWQMQAEDYYSKLIDVQPLLKQAQIIIQESELFKAESEF